MPAIRFCPENIPNLPRNGKKMLVGPNNPPLRVVEGVYQPLHFAFCISMKNVGPLYIYII